MKRYYSLCTILLSIFCFSQNKSGIYSYKSSHYFESINLLKDGTFKYQMNTEFLQDEIFGNWQLRNDSILILDSNPQRSRFVVKEHFKKGKKTTFLVKDFEEDLINYHLYVVNDKRDTIAYRNLFEKSIIKEKPVSFYLIGTNSLHSPVYKVKTARNNFFDIKFETQRVFENEQWKFLENGIVPLGVDGKISKYKLIKE